MSNRTDRNIGLGSLRATADAIEQMFGADDDLEHLGLDEDLDEVFDEDLEEDIDEMFGEDVDFDLLLDYDEDEDDEDDEEISDVPRSTDPLAGLTGRREMANRARAQFRGNGGSSDSFRAGVLYGYAQSLHDAGRASEEFGLFRKFRPLAGPRRIIGAATKGLLGSAEATTAAQQLGQGVAAGIVGQGHVPPTLTPTSAVSAAVAPVGQAPVAYPGGLYRMVPVAGPAPVSAPVPASALAHQLGQRAGTGLGLTTSTAPSGAAPVEAEKQTLPPVFVADKMGFEADADLLEGRAETLHGVRVNLPVEERFGATALKCLVNGQARKSARFAARDAAKNGATLLARSDRVSSAAPFVEDPGAEPVLFGDGRIWDSIYGELVPMPCPSCAPLSKRDAFGGVGQDCTVCDDYGAFLTPTSDIPQWSGGVQYGLIPLLIPLIGAGASAAAPALAEGGKGWLAGKKKEKMADLASREESILARLRKKEEKVSPVVGTPKIAESKPEPSVAKEEKDAFGFMGDDDDLDLDLDLDMDLDLDSDEEDFGFAILGDEIEGAGIDMLLEDEDEISELDEEFGVSEEELAVLLYDDEDEDEDEDEFGSEDASSETLAMHTTCVRALVPASYLRDSQPRRVVK